MKKCYLFLALAAGLLLASCQNEPENQLKKGDFEDVELKADSYWTADTNDGINSFTSGDFTFESYKMVTEYGNYFYGFMVSNITNTEYKDYNDAYKSACGGPRAGKNFGTWCMSFSGGDAVLLAKATKVPGCYLTNSIYAYNSMLNGDAYAKKFGADDWFLLTNVGWFLIKMTSLPANSIVPLLWLKRMDSKWLIATRHSSIGFFSILIYIADPCIAIIMPPCSPGFAG